MSTLRTETAEPARTNGQGTKDRVSELRLEPPAGRRVRVSELLVGAALAVGCALVAVLWHASATERTPVLAVATDVARGDVIAPGDIRVVYVSSDEPIVTLGRSQSAAVVGHVAAVDLKAGTILTAAHVADPQRVEPGEGVVGLALDPGQFPATELAPGDLVNVVTAGDAASKVLAEDAVVFAVESLGGQGRRFVSIRTSEDAATEIAAAAERGPVRLVLVTD
mgnify:CR=1 FL=1